MTVDKAATDQLWTIAYTSTMKKKETLPDILATSNKNNPRDSISGMLWYEVETLRIIQILEGPHNHLERLISTIAKDQRHHIMEILYDRPIRKRCYPSFGMLYGAEAAIADANSTLTQALQKAAQIECEASEKSERMRADAADHSEMSKTGLTAAQRHSSSLQVQLKQLNEKRDKAQERLINTFVFNMKTKRMLRREIAELRWQISEKDKVLEKASAAQLEAAEHLAKQLVKQAEVDMAAKKMLSDAEKAAKEVTMAAKKANEIALREAKHKAEQKAIQVARSAEEATLPKVEEGE